MGFAFKKVKLQVESLSKALSDQIQTVYEWFDETESERTTLFGYIHLTVSKCSFLMAGFSKCTHQHQWCLNDRDCLLIYIYIMCDHQEIMPFVIFALFHSEFPNYSNPTQHDAKLRQYDYLHWCKYISVCSLCVCVCVYFLGSWGFTSMFDLTVSLPCGSAKDDWCMTSTMPCQHARSWPTEFFIILLI